MFISLLHFIDPWQSLTGMDDTSAPGFKCYPNPAKDRLQLYLSHGTALVRLLSLEGKIMIEERIAKGDHRVDISFLTPGFYILECEGRDFKSMHPLVKQ